MPFSSQGKNTLQKQFYASTLFYNDFIFSPFFHDIKWKKHFKRGEPLLCLKEMSLMVPKQRMKQVSETPTRCHSPGHISSDLPENHHDYNADNNNYTVNDHYYSRDNNHHPVGDHQFTQDNNDYTGGYHNYRNYHCTADNNYCNDHYYRNYHYPSYYYYTWRPEEGYYHRNYPVHPNGKDFHPMESTCRGESYPVSPNTMDHRQVAPTDERDF